MNWAAITWLMLTILFLVAEANTVSLISSWFAVGSLVAMIAALLNAPIWLQVVLFLVVSIALLAALRPVFQKFVKPKIVKTNVDALAGTQCYVTAEIRNIEAKGQVKLNGMEWTARSTSGDVIPAGTLVRVDKIEGVKAFVTPMEAKEEVTQ